VLVAHALGAAEDHVVRRLAGRPITRSRDAEFAATGPAATLPGRAAEVKQRLENAMTGVDPASLGGERETPFGQRTVRDLLLHAVAHAPEHAARAELTRDLYIAKRGTR
jgi:hypothetical protein